MEITETRTTFDFSKEKVQTITLAELEATYKENDVYGRPLGGIYHSDLINGISDIARNAGLEVEMGDMFAVNNLDGKRPGVALLPEVEEKEGERSIRAHLLRRVFATIRMAPHQLPPVGGLLSRHCNQLFSTRHSDWYWSEHPYLPQSDYSLRQADDCQLRIPPP